MGSLGAAMALGVIVGPGLGGWLAAESLAMPFFIAAGLSLVALALIAVLVPESLPPEMRKGPEARMRTIQLGMLWQALRGPIGMLLFLLFLVSFGLTNFETVFGLYAAQRFGCGPERVGAILMVVGIVSTAGKATLIGPLSKRWGEARIIKVSLAASSAGFIVLLLAQTYPAVLIATGLLILSKTLLRTSLISLTSRRTTLGQGTAMGLSNSFMSLGRIAGPIWAGLAFDMNVNYPYLSGSAAMLIGFLISLIWVFQPGERPASAALSPAKARER